MSNGDLPLRSPLDNRLLAFRGLVSRCHSGAPAVRITSRESSRTDCAPSSRIDPGIERRPQTIPDPRSAVTPPNVDPKMAIDPETAPPAMEKLKPGVSKEPPRNPPPR